MPHILVTRVRIISLGFFRWIFEGHAATFNTAIRILEVHRQSCVFSIFVLVALLFALLLLCCVNEFAERIFLLVSGLFLLIKV